MGAPQLLQKRTTGSLNSRPQFAQIVAIRNFSEVGPEFLDALHKLKAASVAG